MSAKNVSFFRSVIPKEDDKEPTCVIGGPPYTYSYNIHTMCLHCIHIIHTLYGPVRQRYALRYVGTRD